MAIALRLIEDRLSRETTRRLSCGVNRVVYVAEGGASIDGERLNADEARFVPAEEATRLPGEGLLWIWELVKEGKAPPLAPGATLKLEATVTTLDPGDGRRWLMRCDSVAFPPGGCAYTHVHRGPGIRSLKEGSIRIDTQGVSRFYGPGEAWYESGPEPVFAQADEARATRFIRVMLLPVELRGQSSIRYVLDVDREKPKRQTYRGYSDAPIDIRALLPA